VGEGRSTGKYLERGVANVPGDQPGVKRGRGGSHACRHVRGDRLAEVAPSSRDKTGGSGEKSDYKEALLR